MIPRQAEAVLHFDRKTPGEQSVRMSVQDRRSIDKPARHWDVNNIHCPDLIPPIDWQCAQQMRVDSMPWRWLRRVRSAVNRLNTRGFPHRAHRHTGNLDAFAAQQVTQHPVAGKRIIGINRIELALHIQICLRHRTWLVKQSASADPQQSCRALYRQLICMVDHRLAFSTPDLLSAPAK